MTFILTLPRRAALTAAALAIAITLSALGEPGASAATPSPRTEPAVVPHGAPIQPAVRPTGKHINGTITVDGTVRDYVLYVPKSLPKDTPVPLLVAIHGGLGSDTQFEQNTDFDGLAESNHFIAVYPDGTPTAFGENYRVWNAGACCAIADQSEKNVNDVGFIYALIKKIEHTYDIDKSRVFAAGHSNGAMMSYRLACHLSGTIDAIAVQSGDLEFSPCTPAHPVPVLEIHGTADTNLPINGGPGAGILKGYDFPPPVDALETFAAADKCSSTPTNSTDPSNTAINYEIWQPCTPGTVVEWVKVTGANHAWMGHPPASTAALRMMGPPYMGFDSSAAVWSFLAAHPRK